MHRPSLDHPLTQWLSRTTLTPRHATISMHVSSHNQWPVQHYVDTFPSLTGTISGLSLASLDAYLSHRLPDSILIKHHNVRTLFASILVFCCTTPEHSINNRILTNMATLGPQYHSCSLVS